MTITIGPFFCASPGPPGGGSVDPLNVVVEWAGEDRAVRLELFQAHPKGMPKVRFHHVMARADQLPCDVVISETQAIEAPEGTFIPLEGVLTALYRANNVRRGIREVLRELGAFITLHNSARDNIPQDGLLSPEIEQAGFRIANVLGEGEEVLVELGWRPGGSINQFHTANCRFSVRLGAITEDCWVDQEGTNGISVLLAKELHESFPGSPRALMTQAGLKRVVSLVTPH